jgi:tetratricopeptide repeat protein 30
MIVLILKLQEEKYQQARQKFSDAMSQVGYQPSLAYNIALCHYRLKQFTQARKYILEIFDKAITQHPGMFSHSMSFNAVFMALCINNDCSTELGVGSGNQSTDSLDVHSVGNSQTLRETSIIEALNLKAAVEYDLKNSM